MQHRLVVAVAIALAAASLAHAQYSESPVPGSLPMPDAPTADDLRNAMDDARLDIGPVRFNPWLSLRNVAWVDPGGGDDRDLTASGGLGAEAYLRLGGKAVLTAAALQEYTWWQDSDRDRWHHLYGVGAFGFFNRLTVRGQVTTGEQLQYHFGELENLITLQEDRALGQMELDLPGPWGLFALVEAAQFDFAGSDDDLLPGDYVLLDRDEGRVRGGVRVDLGRGYSVGLGYETMQTDFDNLAGDRSSSGDAPVLEIGVRRPKLQAELHLVYASLDPEPGSEFTPFDGSLSRFQVRYTPRGRLEWSAYGYQNLAYSILSGSSYYQEERVGLAASRPLGWRLNARVFAEAGRRDYDVEQALTQDQDLFSYGAALDMEITGRIGLQLGVSRTEFDGADGSSRSVTRVLSGLALRGFGLGHGGAW